MSDVVILKDDSGPEALLIPYGPTGAKGDPGGNVMAIGLFSAASALSVPVGTDIVRTGGYAANGEGSADYIVDALVDASYVAANPLTSFVSSNGRGFRLNPRQQLSPEMLGFVGNGSADNTASHKALAALVNSVGGGHIKFGQGKTYKIGQHITAANGRTATDFAFVDCNGLIIDLNGAKLDIDGAFDRDLATTQGYSAFWLANCSNVEIFGGELDGNVDQMTNSSVSTEPASYGIGLFQCTDVTLSNLDIHHFSSDGIYLKDNGSNGTLRTACRNIYLRNVHSHYNARQGMSVVQARGVTADNCSFSWTGRSSGTYGTHSPGGGVDVEPNRSTATAAPDTMDVNTGDIVFSNTVFEENVGSQFLCGGSVSYDDVRLLASRLKVGGGSMAGADISILGCPGFVMRDCDIDLGAYGSAKALYVWPNAANVAGDITIANNRFTGVAQMLRTNGAPTGRVVIESNIFKPNGATGYSGATLLNLVSGTDVHFRNNRIFIPKEMYVDGGSGDRHIIMTFSSVKESSGNVFTTDLLAASGDGGTAHYAMNYSAAILVRDDRYTGMAPGTADTIRPVFNGSFNTADPYNRNHHRANAPGVVRPGNAAYTFISTTSPGTVIYDVALTADRAVALDTTAGFVFKGAKARIVRTAAATGAFSVNIGTGPLKALSTAGTWAEVEYDGSAWALTSSGSL